MHKIGLLVALLGISCGTVKATDEDANTNVDAAIVDGGPNSPDASPDCPLGAICDDNVNIAFVTSAIFEADNLDGVIGGNTICNAVALEAGLSGTYAAWLSTEFVGPNLGTASGWVRTDGRPFAKSIQDLENGLIIYPLNLDENGVEVSGEVVTGTRPDGSSNGDTCQDWQSTNGDTSIGIPNSTGSGWTGLIDAPCSESYHLYCFGIDKNAPLTVPSVTGRLAWVSSPVPADIGATNMDATCTAEAMKLGLVSARAFIATATETASSRLNTTGPTWVRPDGVVLWNQASDIAIEGPLAPISLSGDGVPANISRVWAGADNSHFTASSTSDNCSDWTDGTAANRAIVGNTVFAGDQFFNLPPLAACSGQRPLYCFEE